MATGTIIKTRKSKIYHQTVTNKAINTAWGSGMYITTVSVPISISGTVLGALVSFRGSGSSALASLDSVTTQNASVLLARGNSASVSGTITLEVFYEWFSAIHYMASGTINMGKMKLLWENPSPTSAFAAQDINLSGSDYDFLMFIFHPNKNSYTACYSQITLKGKGTSMWYAVPSGSGVRAFARGCIYVSDTKYSIANSTFSTGSAADVTDNNNVIPYQIYGIKN